MDNDFVKIIYRLLEEKKELQKRLDMVETILHSYLPTIIDKKEK
tara:strand:- start:5844 stop:5975 length:132 start_codon:yes stop_codon:yes gene_type:complete